MKIKSGFMTRRLGDKIVAVAVGERSQSFNGIININETGEFIWKCLEKDTTIDEIAQKVLKEYDTDLETAKSAIEDFVAVLRENDLLDE